MSRSDTVYQQQIRLERATVWDTLRVSSTDTVMRWDTVRIASPDGRAELRRWYDAKLNAYRIACEARPVDTVLQVRVQERVRYLNPPANSKPPGGFWFWGFMIVACVLLLLILLRR